MISIIIPTLNEEKYLPKLLQSIKEQDFNGELEIIVADAGSKDKTREIAKSFGCKIVEGGLPAKGRNEGAKKAKSDLLFFVDADILLPKDFLRKALKEFLQKNLAVASFSIHPINKGFWCNLFFNFFYNYPVKVLVRVLPFAAMAILVKKDIHQKNNGFDEKVIFLEDTVYIRKLAKIGKYRLVKSVSIYSSTRRFEKDGWVKTYFKIIVGDIYTIFFKSIKTNIFNYKFNHYDK